MLHTVLIATICNQVRNETTIKTSPEEMLKGRYNPAVNNLLEAFNCDKPENVESFELESIEKCEEKMQEQKIKPAYVQILQETEKYQIKAKTCKLIRTKKFSYCGNADHSLSMYSLEMTHRMIPVDETTCERIHKE